MSIKRVIPTLLLATTMSWAQEQGSIVEGLEVGASYGISTNLIDRGETLTNNNMGGAGAIALGYSGLGVELATFPAGGDTEFDIALGYTYGVSEELELNLTYLNISTSNSGEGGAFAFSADQELSATVAYTTVVDLEFDVMANINDYSFVIYQATIAKSFGDLGVELLYGQSTSDSSENQYGYYQFGLAHPCPITGGEWGVAVANTTKTDNAFTGALSHTLSF
jgi:hypothetical protein